jgi:P27 family predicted phage terminase small subunit
MKNKKIDKYELLKSAIINDMVDRGTWRVIDEHLIDEYIQLVIVADQCAETIKKRGIFYMDERNVERTNPAIRTLNATTSSVNAMAKTLGIGPYSRKLTTGTEQPAQKEVTKVSQLRPIERAKRTN